ncbi:MAG: transposase [Burkholderiaceae bacterium]
MIIAAPGSTKNAERWPISARSSDMARLPDGRKKTAARKTECRRASVRAKFEQPFRVIKRQFGLAKLRLRGLPKNTAHVITLFALSNLWIPRKQLMAMVGAVRLKAA